MNLTKKFLSFFLILFSSLGALYGQHNISGNTGTANTTLTWNDGTAQTANSDASGNYSISVSDGWSGTVTPSKTGYSFNPPNRSYSNVTTDQTNQNYTATLDSNAISGNAGVAGATLAWSDGTNKTTTADANGNYSLNVSYNWSGTVTPSKTGYSFNPPNRSYSNVTTDQTNQNYTATLDSNAISGNAGVAGATLAWNDGTNKTTTADASGNYSLNVSYDWSGTVTPSKTGYTFDPPNRSYSNVTTDQTNQNYTATLDSNAISGNAGVAGATLAWSDGTNKTTTADASGNYSLNVSYNWSGTVTPSKTGYSFNPPNRSYSNVTTDQTNQNYTATLDSNAISGNAGVAGATLSWSDGTNKTTTADASGNYSLNVSYDWSGTVTPSKTGYTFDPPNRSYSNVITDQSGENYTASLNHYFITGNTSEGGVTLTWTDTTEKTIVSDLLGNYSISVPYGWTGNITPSKPGYTFSPPLRTYSNVTADIPAQNYTATLNHYIISGNTDQGGVTLTWIDVTEQTVVSDLAGNYSISVPYNWSGIVTPSKTGYSFTPLNRTYSNIVSDTTNQNYLATINHYTISGNTDQGNVTLTWTEGTEQTTTSDNSGNYSISVLYGWSGTVTPSKIGYTFNPANRTYTALANDTLQQNYIAIINNYTVSTTIQPSGAGVISDLHSGGKYNYGETVNITANANPGYTFKNWTSGSTIISINKTLSFIATKDTSLTANFTHNLYNITATSEPIEGGNTSGIGPAFYGDQRTLIAIANPNWKFVKWTSNGNEVSKDTAYTFTVTGDSSFVAHFKKADLIVNCYAEPSNAGFTSGCGFAIYNEEITVAAQANSGWKFKNWTKNGTVVSTDSQYTFTVLANTELIAHFDIINGIAKANGKAIPDNYYVSNAYPNPFNPSTSFQFGLPEESYVRLIIIDLSGQVVETIVKGSVLSAGNYINHFVADNLTSGIYLYLLSANSTISDKSFKKSGKLMLLK